MHIRTISRVQPQKAYNIEYVLSIINQVINLLNSIHQLIPSFDVAQIVNNLKGSNMS